MVALHADHGCVDGDEVAVVVLEAPWQDSGSALRSRSAGIAAPLTDGCAEGEVSPPPAPHPAAGSRKKKKPKKKQPQTDKAEL